MILSVDATHLLMASEISDVVGMKAIPQTPQGPRAMYGYITLPSRGPHSGESSRGGGGEEIILRSNSPWGFYPFQPPNSPKGQVARVSGELQPCMTRGSPLRPLGCLT